MLVRINLYTSIIARYIRRPYQLNLHVRVYSIIATEIYYTSLCRYIVAAKLRIRQDAVSLPWDRWSLCHSYFRISTTTETWKARFCLHVHETGQKRQLPRHFVAPPNPLLFVRSPLIVHLLLAIINFISVFIAHPKLGCYILRKDGNLILWGQVAQNAYIVNIIYYPF